MDRLWNYVFASAVALVMPKEILANYQGPSFVHEPPSKVTFYNTTGTVLPCTATGNPRPVVRWIGVDGETLVDIPGLRHVRPDGSLVLLHFRARDYRQDVHSSVYRCVASNAVGSVVSRNVHVRGVTFQRFEVRVYDEFVITGNAGVLRCLVPSFVRDYVKVISWKREDGLVILPQWFVGLDSKYIVFPTGELLIRNVGRADSSSTFRCIVKNTLTEKSEESITGGRIIITENQAKVPPRITHSVRSSTASEGSAAFLPCAAQGQPAPSYKWNRKENDQLLYLTAGGRRQHVEGTLVLQQATVQDSGTYVCLASNEVGEARAETHLAVTAPLRVSMWPATQQISAGTSATLNCSVTGSPMTSVIWLKDGRPLVLSRRVVLLSRTVLHITPVQREDRGMYQCFVHNDEDSAQGATQLSIASEPPVLVSKFEELIEKPGSSVSLKCAAIGNPLPQITWYSYGVAVQDTSRVRVGDYVSRDGSVISFVNISRIEVPDGGQYECRVTNDYGMDSHSAFVHVTGLPYIRPMANQTVVAGDVLIVHCPLSGHPIHMIRWERGKKQLPLGRRQKVFTNGTLLIQGVDGSEDAGRYSCEVEDSEGHKSLREMYIKVLVPPLITPFSFPKNPQEGTRASVTCSIPVGDPPIRISWLKDGKPLSLEAGISLEMIDDFVSTLVFKSLRQDHSGRYTCLAVNEAATVNFSVPLSVNAPPKWKVEPTDKFAAVGSSVTLDCLAVGRPEPRVIWKKAIETLGNDYRTIISGSHIQSLVNGSLVIREVEQEDDGRYMCEASNGVGSPLSTVVRLTVHVPAHFKQKFVSETVRQGDTVSLRCEAFGEAPITFLWLKDRQHLAGLSRPRYMLREHMSSPNHVAEITIHVVERTDSGLYTCVATNAYGQDERNIQLTVQERPDPPDSLEVIQPGARSVLLRWAKPYTGNSPLTKYVVQYKLLADSWERDSREISVDGNQTQINIQDLAPLKQYHFRIVADNSIGRSVFSDVLTVVTEGEVPGGPPTHLQVVAKGSRVLHVTWEPPLQSLQHGNIRGYYIGYKEQNSADPYVYKTVEASSTAMSDDRVERSCDITGLRRGVKYTVVAQAFNEKGAGPLSDEVHVQTLEYDPPQSPFLKVASTTSSSALVMWETSNQEDASVSGYIIHWRENGAEWMEVQVPSEKNSHKFVGLQCGTRYQFYITAFNTLGKGEPSDIVSTKTEGSAPVAPAEHLFITKNATTIVLRLSAWKASGCAIAFFVVQYKQQRRLEWTLFSSRLEPMQEFVVIQDLSPGTWYNILVSAHNSVGVTEMEYVVATLTFLGGTVQPETVAEKEQLRKYKSLSIIVPISCAVVVLVAVSLAVFLLVCRKRSTRLTNLYEGVRANEDQKGDSMVMADLEKSYEQSRESVYFPAPYATTRVPVLPRDDGGMDREPCRSLSHAGTRGNDHLYDIPLPLRDGMKRQHYQKTVGEDGRSIFADYEGAEISHHVQNVSEEMLQQDLESFNAQHKVTRRRRGTPLTPTQKWRINEDDVTYSPIHIPTHSLVADGSELSDAECDRDFSHLADGVLLPQRHIRFPRSSSMRNGPGISFAVHLSS